MTNGEVYDVFKQVKDLIENIPAEALSVLAVTLLDVAMTRGADRVEVVKHFNEVLERHDRYAEEDAKKRNESN